MTAALIASCLLPLGLGSGLATTWEASLRTAGGVRADLLENAPDLTRASLELQPTVRATAATHTGELSLSYFPLFTWLEGPSQTWLHLAALEGSLRTSPSWRLRGSLRATRGTSDLLVNPSPQSAAGQPPPSAQWAPAARTLDSEHYSLELGADGRVGPRLDLRTRLGVAREGGLQPVDLALLPLQQAARGSAALDWRSSHTGLLSASLAGEVVHHFDVPVADAAQPGGVGHQSWSTWTGSLTGRWRRDLARDAGGWVGGGLALAGGDGPDQQLLRPLPAAEVGVELAPAARDGRLSGGAVLALAPIDDRRSGAIVERTDLRLYAAWLGARGWSARASVSGGVVVNGDARGEWLGYADTGLGWTARRGVELSLSLRGSVQDQRLPVPTRIAAWSATLGVTLSDHGRL